jgi:hypothetical protein
MIGPGMAREAGSPQDEVRGGPARVPDPFAPVGTMGPFDPPVAGPRPGGARRERTSRKGRPAFGMILVFAVVLRGGREVVGRVAGSEWGLVGLLAAGLVFVALIVAWRGFERRRIRRRGGVEFTPEVVTRQIADSELGPPAFPEDGTVLGASLLVVNQNSKVLELNTTYELFGSNGARIGSVRQIAQSRAKLAARFVTSLDQFFTHHFEVLDLAGLPVLRLTRPAKLFRSRLHVFGGDDRYIGTIRQENVFWKIRFALHDEHGRIVGHLRAENVRAWDFHVYDLYQRPVATVVKSWEGWARTAFTRADRYVVRLHEPLPYPLRQLTLTAALITDLALKQDARGFG